MDSLLRISLLTDDNHSVTHVEDAKSAVIATRPARTAGAAN